MNGQVRIKGLKELIKEKGLTPIKLSRRADLAPFTIYSLVNGRSQKVYLRTLAAICEVLNCQPGDFLEYTIVPNERADLEAPPILP